MKYLILLCDGMSDYPSDTLGGKTPMQAAYKPHMDNLAKYAELGLCKTVQDNLSPGSDVANLSVLGYDPAVYYGGRSPLEAAGIGIEMQPADTSLRCNLVTLSDEPLFPDKTMLDYCADDISTEEAAALIDALNKELSKPPYKFYSGVSYRHLLMLEGCDAPPGKYTPPHDITNKKITPYIDTNNPLYDITLKAAEVLAEHPVNKNRIKNNKRPANSIWLWGEGKKRDMPLFTERFNQKGAMISAVDLLKGIAKIIGMKVINVDGATGYLDTNFKGKAAAAIEAFNNGYDFVYLHIEAPDECGHRGEALNKVKAIELIDELVLSHILAETGGMPIRILIMPDHATPLTLRTHTHDPVPYLLYDSTDKKQGADSFTEETAAGTGIYIDKGHTLIKKLLKNTPR